MRYVLFIVCAILLLFPFSNFNGTSAMSSAYALDEPVSADQNDIGEQPDDVVKTEAQSGQLLVKFKQSIKKSTIEQLNDKINAAVLEEHDNNIYLIEIPPEYSLEDALDFYKQNKKQVEHAEPNFIRQKAIAPNDISYPSQWSLDNTGQGGGIIDADIDAPEVWNTVTDCSSVVVAIIDDGLDYSHEDLDNNLWINIAENAGVEGVDDDSNGYVDDIHGYDFGNDDNNPMPDLGTDKSAGHGTHVAGIIGAEGNNEIGIAGVCWNVKLMPLKIYNKTGKATVNEVVEAINYAIWMKNNGNANVKVINMSFGGKASSTTEFEAMKNLRAAGILVTAAAGNTGASTNAFPIYPASYPLDNILSVASSTNKDQISSFSTYGANDVDLAAPGSSIISTFPGDDYVLMSGTSMAAPHVAGVAALLAANDDTLDYTELRSKILLGVDNKLAMKTKVGSSGRLSASGALSADPALPDFLITDLIVPSSAKLGSEVTVKITIANQGGSYADKTSVRIFASGDPQDLVEFDSASMVGKITINPIEAGKQVAVSTKISLPEILPTVYVLAIIDYDNLVSEFDDNNNSSSQASIPIISNLDLQLSSLNVPDKIKTGKDATISFSVKQKGKSDIDEVAVKLYLSKNNKLDDSDIELVQYTLTSSDILKTKSKETLSLSGEIPKGKHYIIAYVDPDNVIFESKESNNWKARSVKIT